MDNEIQLGVVLPAAGLGTRLPGKTKKQFRKINGKEIFIQTLAQVLAVKYLKEIILVVSKEDILKIKKLINQYYPAQMNIITITEGGTTRQKSVLNGLRKLSNFINMVAIHDAVRPFASTALFDNTLAAARISGGAIPVIPIKETIKSIGQNIVVKTLDRNSIMIAQTPQIFIKDKIFHAHEAAEFNKIECTDDSQIAEIAGLTIATVKGEEYNIKITSPADIHFAEHLMATGIIKK